VFFETSRFRAQQVLERQAVFFEFAAEDDGIDRSYQKKDISGYQKNRLRG